MLGGLELRYEVWSLDEDQKKAMLLGKFYWLEDAELFARLVSTKCYYGVVLEGEDINPKRYPPQHHKIIAYQAAW